jgi:hypothetical protein
MTNGFFRAEQRGGRWWLVDPAGKPFISKGVTTVRYAQDRIQGTSRSPCEEANQAKYDGIAAWREAVAKRLIGWGFNTLGAWSDEALAGSHLAYAPTLDFGGEFVKEKHAGKGAWQHGIFPDVFDPGFAATVRRVAEKTLDGISFNCYALDPRPVIRRYAVFGKPLIIGEIAFRAEDSGLPNTKGAGPKVKNQTERAAAFAKYVELALREPQVVGYHWFEHADEPKEGRFDGENSNYSLVTIQDEPYAEFVETVRRLNGQAEVLHE